MLNVGQTPGPLHLYPQSLQGWKCVPLPSSALKTGSRGLRRWGGWECGRDRGTLQGGHAIRQDTLIQLLVPPVSVYVTHLCLRLFICVHPSVCLFLLLCLHSQPVSTSLGPAPLCVCIVSLFALSLGSPVGFDPLTLSLPAHSNLLSSQSLLLKPSLPGVVQQQPHPAQGMRGGPLNLALKDQNPHQSARSPGSDLH